MKTFILPLLCLTFALVRGQETTLDPLIFEVFGTPGPTDTTANKNGGGLETITVKPTQAPVVITTADGDTCTCVPYYLCDANKVAVYVNNVTVTGWGQLDIRFGEGEQSCISAIELCCKEPKVAPKPTPGPPIRPKGCGYRNPKGLSVEIYGGMGNEAQYGEFPWVVSIQNAINDSYGGVGVIIHPQVVLTGAHIASKFPLGSLKIKAGEWDTQTDKEIYDTQERLVQEIHMHQDFKLKSLKNDMALLRLDSPLQLADHINTLCLPSQGENFDNSKNCVSNGWGSDVFGLTGRYAVILKKVKQNMVSHERCQALLRRTRLGYGFKLHDSFVCAGGEQGQDTCKGDGGAPLACPIGGDRYKLTGLVAWGIGCGEKDVPAVFVNVPAFRQWVDAKMNEWGYGSASYSVEN